MPFCPNCGSYVSPESNVCSCGTTFGYTQEPEEEKPTEFEIQEEEKRKVRLKHSKNIKKLMDGEKYLEAIEYIDSTPEISKSYTMTKAKAYYYAGMYKEAMPLFKQSINTYQGIDNYITYVWIGDTLINLNRFDDAVNAYEKAIDIINEDYERKVNFFKGEIWEGYERIERACTSAREERIERITEVDERILYANELKEKSAKINADSLEKLLIEAGKMNLITITGTRFYDSPELESGAKLKLIRDQDNQFDSDAIAVYLNDKKIGYVANSLSTAYRLTSMASEIQISDTNCARYLFEYQGFHIASLNMALDINF